MHLTEVIETTKTAAAENVEEREAAFHELAQLRALLGDSGIGDVAF